MVITSAASCICGKNDCGIPYGLCHCGCGGKTTIPIRNHALSNLVKGRPGRFVHGHNRKPKPPEFGAGRFKIDGVYCRLIPLTKGMYAIVDESDFTWLSQWRWCASWRSTNATYYAERRTGKHNLSMHRQIMGLGFGDSDQVDHIETGDTLDNRRANLRIATPQQNRMNTRARSDSPSGLKGAIPDKRRGTWYSKIKVGNEIKYLGSAKDAETAHALYRAAARLYFGEFARTS